MCEFSQGLPSFQAIYHDGLGHDFHSSLKYKSEDSLHLLNTNMRIHSFSHPI